MIDDLFGLLEVSWCSYFKKNDRTVLLLASMET